MSKLVPISVAATALGVSTSTLRRWAAPGRLYGSRSHRNHKPLNGMRQAVRDAQC